MIDNEYWKSLQNHDGNTDPLAIILGRLKVLADYADVVNQVIPSIIKMLEVERRGIVIQTEKTCSDTLTMIDEFNDGEESTYETAVKLCDHYRKTIKE